jgi:hypothetical protein
VALGCTSACEFKGKLYAVGDRHNRVVQFDPKGLATELPTTLHPQTLLPTHKAIFLRKNML